MRATRGYFDTTHEGERAYIYTLTNAHGLTARMMTYGAILVSLEVPDNAIGSYLLMLDIDTRLREPGIR